MIFNSQVPAEPTPSTIERLESLAEFTRKAVQETSEIGHIHGTEDCGVFAAQKALLQAHNALVEALEARKAYVAKESRKHAQREAIHTKKLAGDP